MTPLKVQQSVCSSGSVGRCLTNSRSASLIVNIPQMNHHCWPADHCRYDREFRQRAAGSGQQCGAAAVFSAWASACLSLWLFSCFSCWVNNHNYVKHSSYSALDISVISKQSASPGCQLHIKIRAKEFDWGPLSPLLFWQAFCALKTFYFLPAVLKLTCTDLWLVYVEIHLDEMLFIC